MRRYSKQSHIVHQAQLVAESWRQKHPYFAYVGVVRVAYRPRWNAFLFILYNIQSKRYSACRWEEEDIRPLPETVEKVFDTLAYSHTLRKKEPEWGLEPVDITYEPKRSKRAATSSTNPTAA